MNYYPFHIGDFRSGTVNMSRQARWIYRDMLDVYYDMELPLPLDFELLCDEIGVESEDERRIVERLLRFKFIKTERGYQHETCDRVITEYRAKAETAKANGKLGGRPRKQLATDEKPSGFLSGSDQDASSNQQQPGSQANQEPITKNHKPKSKEETQRASRLPADWLPNESEIEFCKAERPDLDPILMQAKFRDYWTGVPGKQGLKLDWAATWRNFIRSERAPAKPASGAWWATDATILAKGTELGMKPIAGESMPAFKGRIQAAIDNGGKPPAQTPTRIAAAAEPVRVEVSPEVAAQRSAGLKSALKTREAV